MIGTLKDVMLNIIQSSDSVNEFRTKTNAIINLLNTTAVEKLPPVYISDVAPSDSPYWLWYNTTTKTLMSLSNGSWFPFHEVYVYEMKFYKQAITADKTIPVGFNAMSVNPTIVDGVTVTVGAGSVWRIQ